MDFFQGGSPPNFVSFYLGNQNENASQIQTNISTDTLTESVQASILTTTPNTARNPIPSPQPFSPIRPPRLPSSPGSSVDVNAYAEERVRLHEEIQQMADQQNREQIAEDSDPVGEEGEGQRNETETLLETQVEADIAPPVFRTSTPHQK